MIEGHALRLIVLDTLEEGRHGGAFCDARADWLRARLDEAPEQLTLVALHHPPMEVGIPWMNTDPHEPWVARLGAVMRGRANVVGMICGHIHRPIAARWEGHVVVTCPSTAPQVGLDLRPLDPDVPDDRALIVADAPGYALHWWNGRELITHWDSAGDKDVLARFDSGLQGMVQHMMAERPRRAAAE